MNHRDVTNYRELFKALAVGWTENGRNRFLIAGDEGQFIRTPESKFPIINGRSYHRHYYQSWDGDIPVETAPYRMSGFIQFESRGLFPDMFKTYRDDQGVYCKAELTQKGYEYAIAGVFDRDFSHRELARTKFFNLTKCNEG